MTKEQVIRVLDFIITHRRLTLLIVLLLFSPILALNYRNRPWWRRPIQEAPWVTRAREAIARVAPPQRAATLDGWTWRPIALDPRLTVRVAQRSPDGTRIEGSISGTPGTLQVSCRARTRFTLLEGWMTLRDEDGPPVSLRAGDSLVIEPGFHGSWQNETGTHLNFRVTLPL